MIIFWLGVVLLLAIALMIILVPLLQTPQVTMYSRKAMNVAIYEENTAQLQTQLNEGLIDQDKLPAMHLELKHNLLDDVVDEANTCNLATQRSWISALFLLIALPLFTIIFYLNSDNSQQMRASIKAQQEAVAVQQMRVQLGTPQQVIASLQQHLAQNPNSAQGWYLLGRLYLSQEQLNEAVNAFAKAYALDPNKPDIIFQYAQALYLTQHSLKGKPTELLQKLLQIQPANDQVTNLLAVAAFARGDYQQAINSWEKLLPHYPAGSPDEQALLQAIARAQAELIKR